MRCLDAEAAQEDVGGRKAEDLGIAGRVVVLGTGSIGMRHLEVLRGIPPAHPVALSVHPQRRLQVEARGHATVRDLDQAVQLGATHCIVATETGRHMEDSLSALERGLDVLVEKPLAVDASEARRLCARAAVLHRRIFVGCVLRFSESLHTFRRLLPERGRLHSVRIECQSYLPDWRPGRSYREAYSARAAEGGVLRDLIHEIDYAGWLFGWPQRLQASLRNLGRLEIAAEELAELRWEIPTGGGVSLHLDYLSRPPRRRLTAWGGRGTIEWDGIAQTVALDVHGVPARVIRSPQTRDEMFAAEARAFLNAVGGTPDPRLATGEGGIRAPAIFYPAPRGSER